MVVAARNARPISYPHTRRIFLREGFVPVLLVLKMRYNVSSNRGNPIVSNLNH